MTALSAATTDYYRKEAIPASLPRQLLLSQWPHKMIDVSFVIDGNLLEWARKLGLDPQVGSDNLDDYDAALVRIDLGNQIYRVGLQTYRGSPGNCNVMIERISDEFLAFLVNWLGMTVHSLKWSSPAVKAGLSRAMNRRR